MTGARISTGRPRFLGTGDRRASQAADAKPPDNHIRQDHEHGDRRLDRVTPARPRQSDCILDRRTQTAQASSGLFGWIVDRRTQTARPEESRDRRPPHTDVDAVRPCAASASGYSVERDKAAQPVTHPSRQAVARPAGATAPAGKAGASRHAGCITGSNHAGGAKRPPETPRPRCAGAAPSTFVPRATPATASHAARFAQPGPGSRRSVAAACERPPRRGPGRANRAARPA
jgi:hypothetical protein